jgi:hypothetical protein
MKEKLFEKDFKYHTQLYYCQWEDSLGIYTFDELRSLMARVSQLEEIDDINYDKGSNKWSYWELDFKEERSIHKEFDNLLQVVRYMQDNAEYLEYASAMQPITFLRASAICHNMRIARIN